MMKSESVPTRTDVISPVGEAEDRRAMQMAEGSPHITEAGFWRLFSESADGMLIVTLDGLVRFANPAAEALFGRTEERLVGSSFGFPMGDGAEIEVLADDKQRATVEMRVVETSWEGSAACVVTLRNITERKRAMEAMQESESKLRLLLEQVPCILWTLDKNMRFTSVAGSAMAHLAINPDRIVGMTLSEFFEEDDMDFVVYVACRAALQGRPMTYELERNKRIFHNRTRPLRNPRGQIEGVVGVASDITELKEAETRLRSLSRRLTTAQEDERRRIARELHDEVGQSLTGLKMTLERIPAESLAQDGSELRAARMMLGELMAQVRRMSVELRPTVLDDLGLLPALLWHFRRYTAQTKVKIRFKHSGLRRDLPQDIATAAYRIVQESLNNVARHAQVDEVLVVLRVQYDALLIEVEDQGVGFDTEETRSIGLGLDGMRERALSLNGRLLVQSRVGEGTCVVAEMPLPKKGQKRTRSKEDDNGSSR